jgi:hypothetical protein
LKKTASTSLPFAGTPERDSKQRQTICRLSLFHTGETAARRARDEATPEAPEYHAGSFRQLARASLDTGQWQARHALLYWDGPGMRGKRLMNSTVQAAERHARRKVFACGESLVELTVTDESPVDELRQSRVCV